MEGDRGINLMVQAAAQKGLDFATANPRSRQWWLKVRWILDLTEDRNSQQIFKMQHEQHVGILDHHMDKTAFEHHWGGANKLLRDTYKVYFPWVKEVADAKSPRDKSNDDLMATWRKLYGDPNDPKVRAKFKSIAEAMRRKSAEGQTTNFSDTRTLSQRLRKVAEIRRNQQQQTQRRRGR